MASPGFLVCSLNRKFSLEGRLETGFLKELRWLELQA